MNGPFGRLASSLQTGPRRGREKNSASIARRDELETEEFGERSDRYGIGDASFGFAGRPVRGQISFKPVIN